MLQEWPAKAENINRANSFDVVIVEFDTILVVEKHAGLGKPWHQIFELNEFAVYDAMRRQLLQAIFTQQIAFQMLVDDQTNRILDIRCARVAELEF